MEQENNRNGRSQGSEGIERRKKHLHLYQLQLLPCVKTDDWERDYQEGRLGKI